MARALVDAGVVVLGFIDRNGGDRTRVDGLRVLHPNAIRDSDIVGTFHVHALMNHYASSLEVTHWAVGRPFAGTLFPADLYRIPGFVLRNYWLAPPAETLAHLDSVEAIYDAFEDEESRSLLRSLLLYRLSTDPRLHPEVRVSEAYMLDFLPIFDKPITFIDGGAYTGDTLEALLDRQIAIADWIAFEPDARNMKALRETAHRVGARVGSYTLLQLGLSDCNGSVAFAEGGGEASHLIADSGIQSEAAHVDVVCMDAAIKRVGNVYIKLDIEGAEMEALRGMPRLLESNPLIAVSIYHKPNDLWEIPLYLMKRAAPAKLRIRQHGHHGFDTVLYVTPK